MKPKVEWLNRRRIVAFLGGIGATAVRVVDSRWRYYRINSREEIVVDDERNRWGDAEESSRNGTLVSLVKWLYRTDDMNVVEFLLMASPTVVPERIDGRRVSVAGVRNISFSKIQSREVCSFLSSHGISPEMAARYFYEASFRLGNGLEHALVIPNDAGGRLIVSSKIQERVEPNAVTTFRGRLKCDICYLFLGYLDMLSFCQIVAMSGFEAFTLTIDMVILNSVSNIDGIAPMLNRYESVCCCLPLTYIGQRAMEKLSSLDLAKLFDCSEPYRRDGSLNRFLRNNKRFHALWNI